MRTHTAIQARAGRARAERAYQERAQKANNERIAKRKAGEAAYRQAMIDAKAERAQERADVATLKATWRT